MCSGSGGGAPRYRSALGHPDCWSTAVWTRPDTLGRLGLRFSRLGCCTPGSRCILRRHLCRCTSLLLGKSPKAFDRRLHISLPARWATAVLEPSGIASGGIAEVHLQPQSEVASGLSGGRRSWPSNTTHRHCRWSRPVVISAREASELYRSCYVLSEGEFTLRRRRSTHLQT